LPARAVTVRRFDVVARRDVVVGDTALVDLDVVVECSSGTYVRALARDLGAGLGIGGHLTALCRTRVGPFVLAEAHRLDGSVLPLTDTSSVARRCFPTMILSTEDARAVRFGRRLTGRDLPDRLMALFDPAGEFLALYRAEGADAAPEAVFVG
jgi:tRNA pseudouridine55 synthase